MKKYMAVRDYNVKLVPFPNNAADSCVVSDPDGSGFLTIVINANLCQSRQEQAYRHELAHIMNDDLYSDKSVYDIECQVRTVGL